MIGTAVIKVRLEVQRIIDVNKKYFKVDSEHASTLFMKKIFTASSDPRNDELLTAIHIGSRQIIQA